MRAVVIGSGAAGLTTAILLATRGWDVTVLEQHTRAGGYLHRFFREGVGYDTGFHYIGSAGRDQLIGRILSHLGVYDQLQFSPLDPDGFDIIRFPGFEISVPVGLDAWMERLAEQFPGERQGLVAYRALHLEAVAAYGWYNLDITVPAERVLPFEERSLQSVLDALFADPRIRSVIAGQSALYGVPPQDAPFGLHAIVTDHFLGGAYTIGGGGDKLAMALVRRLRALGGRLVLKTAADRIELDGRTVRAVHAGGERYPADAVFANLHPRSLLPMLPEGAVRPAYVTRVSEATPGRAHLGLYLRVKGDLSDLARRNLYRFATWDIEAAATPSTPEDVPFWFLTAPGPRVDRPLSGSEDVVLGLVQVDQAAYGPWVGGTDDAYRDHKARQLDASLVALRRDYPDWDIVRAEASTPITTERFTRSPLGATYGHYHSVAQMGRYRLPSRTRVTGLTVIGQTVGFPGICGAMMTAYVACADILGADALVEELRTA